MPAKFITVEGIEGSGKSSVMSYLSDELLKLLGGKVVVTREPGGTPLAEQIRELFLKDFDETVFPLTELLLIYAGRNQHIHNFILPHLSQGHHVLSDRYFDATIAYQGGGRSISMEKIHYLNDWVVQEVRPDLTILLDVPVEVGMRRIGNRAKDRMENDSIEFFERVRQGYLSLAQGEPDRYAIIDATCSMEAVQDRVRVLLKEKFEEECAAKGSI